jgi:hypothetical protein
MRHFILAAIVSVAIFVGASHAQEAQSPAEGVNQAAPQGEVVKAKKYKEVPVDRNGDLKIDGVDIYDNDNRIVRKGYDDDGDGMNDRYLDIDPNTGMPMTAASDQEFGD